MSRCIRCGCLFLVVLALAIARADAGKPEAPKVTNPEASKAAKTESAKKKDKPAKAKAAKKKADEPAKTESGKKKDEAAKAEPATQTIKREPLKITVELDGAFEPRTAAEVVVKPDEWSGLTVLSAVPHGARVRKGDVLLKLETEKLDKAIADLRHEIAVSELGLRQSRQQLQALEKTTPLDLEAGRRAARIVVEDKKNFDEVERPFVLRAIDFNLRAAKEQLEYEEEELHQLEKMYKADDITEETEQIVLKRGRDAVDRAKFAMQATQIMHDQALKFMVPRRDADVKEMAQRRAIEWEKAQIELPLALHRAQLEFKKLELQYAQTEERLKKLLADRKLMTVQSPAEGIVYYGKFTRGTPGDSSSLTEAALNRGGIQPGQVVMTIVQPRPVWIRATAPEARLSDLRPGIKGFATPTACPDLQLPATLDDIGELPMSPGNFDARLKVDLSGKTKLLLPGMTCKVKLVAYLNRRAITIAPKSLMTDEIDEQKHSVQVLDKDGKPKERPVVVGRKTDKQVEIVKGLSEGDRVVLEPEKTATDAAK